MDTQDPAGRLEGALEGRVSRRRLLRQLAATALAVPAVGALLTACAPSAPRTHGPIANLESPPCTARDRAPPDGS